MPALCSRTGSDRFPRGDDIVRLVDKIAAATAGTVLEDGRLVHGNFCLGNAVDDGDRVWLVDAATVGAGTVAYDAAEALVTAAARPSPSPAGAERLWQWVDRELPAADVAICCASVCLTMADAYDRLGYLHEGPSVAPGIVAALARVYGRGR